MFRVKTPFDFVVSKKKMVLFCDTKTTGEDAFPYSAIDQNQLKHLLPLHENGFMSGYIIHFRNKNAIVFVSAGHLSEINPRGSIKWDDPRVCQLGEQIEIDKLFCP